MAGFAIDPTILPSIPERKGTLYLRSDHMNHSTAFPRKAFLLGPVKSTYCQRTKGTLVIHSPPPLPSHTHTHIHKHTHTYTNTHTHTQTHTHAHPPPFINCITVMQTENKVGLGTRLTFSPSLLKNGP